MTTPDTPPPSETPDAATRRGHLLAEAMVCIIKMSAEDARGEDVSDLMARIEAELEEP